MEDYNTPMISSISDNSRMVKPGVAVPVAAIYALAVTTVAAYACFLAVQGAAVYNGVVFWD